MKLRPLIALCTLMYLLFSQQSYAEVRLAFASGAVTIVTRFSDSVELKCKSNRLRVNGKGVGIFCAAITSISISGDDGANTFRFIMDGEQKKAWTALTAVTISSANGADQIVISYPVSTVLSSPPVIAFSLDGGDGIDSVQILGSPLRDRISSTSAGISWGFSIGGALRTIATVAFLNIESTKIFGGLANDIVDLSGLTSTYPFEVFGGSGNDTLTGGLGRDTLRGEIGNDTLSGGANVDRLFGGNGADELTGGDGNDLLLGESGNDLLNGGDGDDNIKGAQGQDILIGGAGDDSLTGGYGDDTLQGNDDIDTLDGGEGNDSLEGGAGDDQLRAGPGNDSLNGADDFDTVAAGPGQDFCLDVEIYASCETLQYTEEDPGEEEPEE